MCLRRARLPNWRSRSFARVIRSARSLILADAEEEQPQLSLDPDLAFVRGQAYAALKDYRKASEAYLASATIRDSDDAWFNAASCAISADISDSDNVGWNHLLEKEPNGRRVRELALAAALHAAGAKKLEAGKMLNAIAEGDDADLSARARLALSGGSTATNDLRGRAPSGCESPPRIRRSKRGRMRWRCFSRTRAMRDRMPT